MGGWKHAPPALTLAIVTTPSLHGRMALLHQSLQHVSIRQFLHYQFLQYQFLHDPSPVNCIGRGRGRGGGSSRPTRTRRTAVCAANALPRGASRDNAISARGHSKRGRVKQKGSKKADLVEAGAMVFDRAWCNAGERGGRRGRFTPACYISTLGFKCCLLFRSSVPPPTCPPHTFSSTPAGYIFTSGFKSRLLFRSSVNLDALCIHECEILAAGAR